LHNEQRHLVAHSDDIRSLAMSNGGSLVATGGQGRKPEVVVWDPATLITACRLEAAELNGKRAVKALCFSPDDGLVVAACDDNDHTLLCFSVATGGLVDSAKGGVERIMALAWAPEALGGGLVSAGVKHFVLWPGSGGLGRPLSGGKAQKGLFGNAGRTTLSSACFAGSKGGGNCFTGSATGAVYAWLGRQCCGVIDAHGKGCPVFSVVAAHAVGRPDILATVRA